MEEIETNPSWVCISAKNMMNKIYSCSKNKLQSKTFELNQMFHTDLIEIWYKEY